MNSQEISNVNSSIFERFFLYSSQERFLKGASLARIGLGLIILYNYLIVYFQRGVIYGPYGIIGNQRNSYTLYNLLTSNWYFELIYHSGILFALLFVLGYKGRIVSIINYILTLSFIRQGFLITDGGDNLMYLLLFYLLFANTTAYYSLDALKKKKVNKEKNIYKISSIFHNFSIVFCIIQICMLYFISGLYQVQGEKWANGTAVYYIMQTDVFSNPNLTSIIMNNDYLIVLTTYASIIVKLAFPFLILNKKTKYLAVISIIGFHIGIGIFMGLITFSLTMIIAELLLFTDKEYTKLGNSISKLKVKLATFQRGIFFRKKMNQI